jgi:benzil reductase ((S)-benzoin forming)
VRVASQSLVWITGASAGIGASLAAAVPFDATVVDISRSGGGPATEHLRADLGEPSSWAVVADHLHERLDGFDGDRAVFIHNAATIEPIGFAGEVDPDAYRGNVMLNAAAPPIVGDAFLRAVRGATLRHGALLLMLTSGAARNPYPGWSGYCAGKAAVDQWVRCVAHEQRERASKVRVVAIGPGTVDTKMQQRVRATPEHDFPFLERFARLHRAGELADPASVAARIWAAADSLSSGEVADLRTLGW